MSQAAAQQPSRKKTVISLLVLLALTCIIVFTFKDHWAEITAALAQLSVWQVLPLAHTNMMAGRKPICIASVLPFAICLHLSSSSILRPGFIILPILNYPKR
jgi:hypothetical protein